MIDVEECRRLHSERWSHRKLAAHYGVSLRQVQKALDAEKRRAMDKAYSKRLGLDAALAIIEDRKQHWKAKRANKGFPIGMVETELRLVEEKIQARRTA